MANLATEAYYNWQSWETTGDPRLSLGDDNPPFSTEFYSKMPGELNIQRGYMRSALPEQYGNTRFHFQFNPNAIVRANEVNEGALAENLQTVEDMKVAALSGAGAVFQFALLLDRQDEVAVGAFRVSSRSNGRYDPRRGVNVDIEVFDKLAGIGNTSVGVGDDFSYADPGGLNQRAAGETQSSLDNMVTGNQVFMASRRPIRVVFSHMLMVEGFIERAEVTYAKFSVGMVPTMANLGVTMRAMYIGAARAQPAYYLQAMADQANSADQLQSAVQSTFTLGVSTTISDPTDVQGALDDAAAAELATYGNGSASNQPQAAPSGPQNVYNAGNGTRVV